jgi:hypothetical protein
LAAPSFAGGLHPTSARHRGGGTEGAADSSKAAFWLEAEGLNRAGTRLTATQQAAIAAQLREPLLRGGLSLEVCCSKVAGRG